MPRIIIYLIVTVTQKGGTLMKCHKFNAVFVCASFMIALLSWGCGTEVADEDRIAPLLKGMGDHHHKVTTNDSQAQRFFDQGLILSYGFNHAEAERSFRQAALLDSNCAMAYWGIALVLGPNINARMNPEDNPKAYKAMQKALQLAENVSANEQAYIQALSKRYALNAPEDRTALDQTYADAMRQLAQQYPGDLDAATLCAEALMDLHPWNYWKADGNPQPWTLEILNILEAVIKRSPNHPGANHFYIHAIEASLNPERALASADRLRNLVPGAGHLVHMPSHIYIRIGKYHEGSLANEHAIAADAAYITQCRSQGIYPLAYHPHNYHFLWATATFEGRSKRAIEAARELTTKVHTDMMREPGYGTLQHYYAIPFYTLVKFGKWDDILNEPAPPADLLYPSGVWRFARGMAFIRTGQLQKADVELSALREIANDTTLKHVTIWEINTTYDLMQIAETVLSGELAAKHGDYEQATDRLEKGVRLERELTYDEPPPWHSPVGQNLGAVLLEAGKPAEAEKVYRQDLQKYPENGWSLYGLYSSLKAQGRMEEAQKVKLRFEEAWQSADVHLNSSRF